jgi:hypothetical protein
MTRPGEPPAGKCRPAMPRQPRGSLMPRSPLCAGWFRRALNMVSSGMSAAEGVAATKSVVQARTLDGVV